MFTVILVFHILVSVCLVLSILVQSSKGEGLAGSAFGGGLSGAVFGGRGAASFMSKATTVLAILFMLNSGALAFMSSGTRTTLGTNAGQVESVVTQQAQREREQAIQQQQQQQGQAPAESLASPIDLDASAKPDTSGQK